MNDFRVGLDTDAALFHESLERYAAERYGLARRRAIVAGEGWSREAWRDYAAQGWLALCLPEDCGGAVGSPSMVGALMDVVGHRLLMEPLLATVVLGPSALMNAGTAEQRSRWLPRIADGSAKIAFAGEAADCTLSGDRLEGTARAVLHADIADVVVVVARGSRGAVPCLVSADQLQRTGYRLVDGRGAADLSFASSLAEPLGDGAPDVARVLMDEAAVALCAESLGVMRGLVAATREHLVTREQFGKPLAANQALTHRFVELYLLQEEARALTTAAQRALSVSAPVRARTISGAWAYIAGALRRVAAEAVQMHGGIGITEELIVSHYFRRAIVLGAQLGGRDRALARFGEASAA